MIDPHRNLGPIFRRNFVVGHSLTLGSTDGSWRSVLRGRFQDGLGVRRWTHPVVAWIERPGRTGRSLGSTWKDAGWNTAAGLFLARHCAV